MLPAFVLDTSVIIKWFRQEEILAAQALELRSSYLEGRIAIAIPSLLAYELANVLRYKADLSTSQVEEAVQSLFDLGLNWVLPSAEIMRLAVSLARKYEITVYDATFIALAELLKATFVTADRQLISKVKSLPFVHLLGE